MSITSFATPVMLPWFENDVQQPDILCAGAIYAARSYDGFRNKIEITPIAHDPRFICPLPGNAVGQPYTIGEAHLQRLLCAANAAKSQEVNHG